MVGYDDLLSEVVVAIANSRAEFISRTNGLVVELFGRLVSQFSPGRRTSATAERSSSSLRQTGLPGYPG